MRCLVVFGVAWLCALAALAQTHKRRASPSPSPAPFAESAALKGVKWQEGPSIGTLGNTAEVHLAAGYVFAGANDTRVLMEAMHNPPSNDEVGFVAPANKDWFVVFEFNEVGYVKDDEKNSLNADAMLESIKAGNEEGNKERQKRGWPSMSITGWEQRPHYNETTHNLEWAIRGETEGEPVINFNTRLLGRGGVMKVTLVTDPSTLSDTLPKFKDVLAGFDFKQGQKYAEFRPGDKIAEYGLSALIVGGTTAVLVKTGMFKWLWKAIVAGIIGISAFLKKIFSRNKTQ
jgi:uncharacterized membrane-anchored protein